MKNIAILLILIIGSVLFAADQSNQIRQQFETRYQAWSSWRTNHAFLSTYTGCDEYRAIINLGPQAIPFIIAKMNENTQDFHLSYAVEILSKRHFEKTEWPTDRLGDSVTRAQMYIKWWQSANKSTERDFGRLYDEFQQLKSQKREADALGVRRRITDLGILALPFLVSKANNDNEMIVVISELTDGELPKSATILECQEWWKNNSSKWVLTDSSFGDAPK